jgi:AraC-like DNA-binding protein
MLAAPVRHLTRPPTAALAPFVAAVWHFESNLPHSRERILPHGAMQLLINLEEDELRSYHGDGYRRVERIGGAGLCGAYASHFGIDTAEQRWIVGVVFRPGGAQPFFAAPADETRETHVPLDALWGRDGARLRERLLDAPTPEARLAIVEAVLLARAVRPLERDPAVDLALAAFERGATVAAVSDRLGLTPKRFLHRFSAAVGLTPKRYARVRRFQRVLAAIAAGRPVDWARVAADCGYFDQAHLIRDFRAFADVCPTSFRAHPEEWSHVVLDEA